MAVFTWTEQEEIREREIWTTRYSIYRMAELLAKMYLLGICDNNCFRMLFPPLFYNGFSKPSENSDKPPAIS